MGCCYSKKNHDLMDIKHEKKCMYDNIDWGSRDITEIIDIYNRESEKFSI